MESVPADDVSAFRHFNRTWTRLIGTLDEGLLSTEYSLTEARVIYELATREEPNSKEIAEALTLDPGYLSRILTRFETSGLIRRKVSKQDSRAAQLSLTRRGKSAFKTLNMLSQRQAGTLLDGLPPADRTRLIQSMKTMQEIVMKDQPKPQTCVLRPHRPGDMGWVVHREATLYAQEYGFDETFEALVARIVSDFATNLDPKRERCWIAELDGQPAGHIFLVKDPAHPGTAKLRLLLVEPWARGKGVGHILTHECIRFARASGYSRITLWTQSILTAAHRIYDSAGFRLVKEERHRSFSKDLIGQTWELDLRGISTANTAATAKRTAEPSQA
jgi:DNA-binding MarR family transcriptional regulator/GNAT superfamily N-acetyltransferase